MLALAEYSFTLKQFVMGFAVSDLCTKVRCFNGHLKLRRKLAPVGCLSSGRCGQCQCSADWNKDMLDLISMLSMASLQSVVRCVPVKCSTVMPFEGRQISSC